ncbi:hypothetical protein FQN57_002069 [Myotisia sp. PD_48]|nr:hypothetical protein FQN57_002069 [Myotisia sp. PD_48]
MESIKNQQASCSKIKHRRTCVAGRRVDQKRDHFLGILKHPSSGGLSISPPQESPTGLSLQEYRAITVQNTLQNAGRTGSHKSRRNTGSSSYKSAANPMTIDTDENAQRLKWDEANLYLTEQDRSSTMKIDEPKTPYAPTFNYMDEADDDDDDIDEAAMIDNVGISPREVTVDELDLAQGKVKESHDARRMREADIPDLELGEANEALLRGLAASGETGRITRERSVSIESAGKRVSVGEEMDEGEEGEDELKKHEDFEKKRKQHYEMTGIKGLLGHPEELDVEDDEDDDEDSAGPKQPPDVPKIPEHFKQA